MLLRATLNYLPAQVIGPLFQLISVVVWTHVVSEPTLGVITLVTATQELLQTVFLLWWSQYTLRFFGTFRDDEESARFYRTENVIFILSAAIQGVVVLAILRLVIVSDAGNVLTLAVAAYAVTRAGNLYIAERARARNEVGVYSVQQLTGPAFGFLLGVALIHWFGDRPEWPIAGYALAQFAALIVVVPAIHLSRAIGPLDWTILRRALGYGIPLVVGGGMTWISINASRFVISDMLGLSAAGLFAVGYGLGFRASTVAAMMVTASAFPLAVRAMEEQGSDSAMRQLADNGALLAAVLVPSVAGIFILRDEIVPVLIAPKFQAATLAVLPLAALAGGIRNFRAHFADQAFLLHKNTRAIIGISGLEAVLTVSMSVLFVSWWGLTGAVLAGAVATAIAATVSFCVGISLFDLKIPVKHFLKCAVATSVMTIVLSVLPRHAAAMTVAMHIALGATVYAAVLAVLYRAALMRLWSSYRAEPV